MYVMKKNLLLIAAILLVNLLAAQPIDYDNLAKEYRDIAIQALASASPSTKKWVEETALKHPPGKFDLSWVRNQLGMLSNGIGTENPEGGLWAVMLAYQKIMNKEAREDRKISRTSKELEVKNKEAKVASDNKAIDQQKRESNEKYDNAMNAANTELKTGVISTSNQVATNQLRTNPDSIKHKTVTTNDQKIMQVNIQKLQDQLATLKKNPNF